VKERKDIRELSEVQLREYLELKGEKPFRAKQIYDWLWKKGAKSFDDMTNLSLDLRKRLSEDFQFHTLDVYTQQKSSDGTIKLGFELSDNRQVEGVLIPTESRMTACVSSQVGCSLNCTFCATGYLKRDRNLKAYEIVDQVQAVNDMALENYGKPLSNIVFMGMGEPLLNYKEVNQAIQHITSPEGLGMSPSRITLSTAGISKMIMKLADDGVKYNLALSLHASTNEKRSKIMPITDSNPLESLIEALNYFMDKTNTRVTLEYCVIAEVNDFLDDAEELAEFCNQLRKCKVNLIEYNPIDMAEFQAASGNRLYRFANELESRGVIVNVRRSRGKDIDAACGQLANKS
jgi:23S rRNA (adenine2503-C2)-methyltransferase